MVTIKMAPLRIAAVVLTLFSLWGGFALAQLPDPDKGSDRPVNAADRHRMLREILKQDMQDNEKDLRKLQELVASVQEELLKSKQYALPVRSVKQLEEIEKISKRIRGRLKRF